MSAMQGAIPAQNQESIQLESFDSLNDFMGNIDGYFFTISDDFARIWIATIRGAQNRATPRQNAAYIFNTKWNNTPLIYETVITIADTNHLVSIFVDGCLHGRSDHRFKPGASPPPVKIPIRFMVLL